MGRRRRGEALRETDANEFVDVPGETTLWKTQGIPPRRIDLPFEVHGRFRWYYLIFGFAAALALSSSVKFYSVAMQNWETGNSLDRMAWAAEVLGCFSLSVFSAGMLVRMVLDATSSLPLLVLTKKTFWDKRQSKEPVPWGNAEQIRFQSSRSTLVVHLKLAQPVYVRSGLFRFGGALKSGLKSNVIVLISDMDQDEGTIAKVIVALAKNARPGSAQ